MLKSKVLLTCIGGRFSINTIKALKKPSGIKVKVVGVDMKTDVEARHYVDAFYTVPAGSDKEYITRLLDIAQKERVEIIMPCSDEEAIALCRAKGNFAKKGITCAVDKSNTVELVTDKCKLFEFLSQKRIPMPRFKPISCVRQISDFAQYLDYPKHKFVIKPARSRGARDVWVIGEDAGMCPLKKLLRDLKERKIKQFNYLAMEFLPGPAYDVDLLAKNGRPLCILNRRRLWRNKLSGFSQGCIVEENKPLTDFVAKASALLKLNYVYDFDCGTYLNGMPAVYEINPRFSGAIAAGIGSGVNIPQMLIRMIKGLNIPKQNIKFNVSMFPVSGIMCFKNNKKICR